MKIIKIAVLILITIVIILIDLPDNLPIKFSLGKFKVDYTIQAWQMNVDLFGLRISREFKTHYGLDLKGGSHLVFETNTSKLKKDDITDALNSSRDIIEKRVNFFGVSEPVVQTLKSNLNYRIVVDLPGITDVSQAVRLIGRTAQLEFRQEANDPKIATNTPKILLLTKKTGLTGRDIKKASVTFDPQDGKPQVSLSFTKKGSEMFAEITKNNVGKQVGIFLDEIPISAPVVQQPILDGSAVITGDFTVDEAKKLAIEINSGALPVPIILVEQKNIGPSLGAEQIRKSVYAGLIGLLMVIVFMVGYYKRLGVIAALALIIYGLLSLAFFRIIPVVLTLPGIAGFLLSIGMAVDSNILIFERIKEELRKGRDFDTAIKFGFGRAIDAIKDANITTLLVAFILFNPLNWEFLPQFGMVRGFALTLAIGVATSLFTGIVITRRLINIFYKK